MRTLEPKLFRFLGWNTQGDLGPYTFYTSKRKGLVFFVKAPPTTPPTSLQLSRRNRWRLFAWAWSALTPEQRGKWSSAAHRASLRISGYNLWIFWCETGDRPAIRTVEKQSGVTLL
jgi:hypothetical protein